jgi:hypothetical protein
MILSSLIKNPLVITGIALAVTLAFVGTYVKGRYDGAAKIELEYAKEKATWVSKVDILQSDLQVANDKINKTYNNDTTKIKEVVKYIHTKPKVITKYITVEADSKCEIPQGFVDLHNKAADGVNLGELVDEPLDPNNPSDKKLSDVGKTVVLNYYEYNQMKTKLEALQAQVSNFMKKQKELINE